jgi:hypothetical protein
MTEDTLVIPIATGQYNKLVSLQAQVLDLEKQRDLVLFTIIAGTEYADKSVVVEKVDEKGIHFKLAT